MSVQVEASSSNTLRSVSLTSQLRPWFSIPLSCSNSSLCFMKSMPQLETFAQGILSCWNALSSCPHSELAYDFQMFTQISSNPWGWTLLKIIVSPHIISLGYISFLCTHWILTILYTHLCNSSWSTTVQTPCRQDALVCFDSDTSRAARIRCRSHTQKTNFCLLKGKRGGTNWGFVINRYILHVKWIKNRDLLYDTGNYHQHPVLIIAHHGKESERVGYSYISV